MKTIFISYNPSESQEQSLALRLQTLGSLYGLHISLPDRIGSTTLKDTTKSRIENTDLFIVFSTKNLSKPIKDEIAFARSLKKRIVVVYDKDVTRNLNLDDVHEIEFDKENDSPEKVLKKILEVVRAPIRRGVAKKIVTPKQNNDSFAGFLLVGLGLLLLAAFVSGDKK